MQSPFTIFQATRRATPEQEAAVEHVEIRTPQGVPGLCTGIVSVHDDGDYRVLLYSARCVHDIKVIPKDWLVKRTPDPRPIS